MIRLNRMPVILLFVIFCASSFSNTLIGPEGETVIGLGQLSQIARSPDGRYTASAGNLGLFLWDNQTGESIDSFIDDPDPIYSVVFTPDGSQLIFRSKTTLYQWDFLTDRAIVAISQDSASGGVPYYSPDGSLQAEFKTNADSYGVNVEIRRVESDEPVITLENVIAPRQSFAFLPNDRFMIPTEQKMLIVWDLNTGDVVNRFGGFWRNISSLAYAPDGKTALIGTEREGAYLWDLERNRVVFVFDRNGPWTNRGNPPSYVSYGLHGDFLVTGSNVCKGEFSEGNFLLDYKASHNIARGRVYAMNVFPDRDWVFVSALYPHSLMIYDVASGETIVETDVPHTPLSSAAFSPGGDRLILGASDGTLMAFNLESMEVEREWAAHGGPINDIDFSHDGERFVSAGSDGYLRFWDANTLAQFDTFHDESPINSVRFSRDKAVVLVANASGCVVRVDVDEDEVLSVFQGIRAVFSPDETSVLVADDINETNVSVWDVASGTKQMTLENLPVGETVALPDGESAVMAREYTPDEPLVRMDLDSHEILTRYPIDADISYWNLLLTTDGNVLLGAVDRMAYIWDVLSGELIQKLTAHDSDIKDFAFFEDGERFLSCSESSIKQWRIGDDLPLVEYYGHTGVVRSADVAPAANRFVMGLYGYGKNVLLGNLDGQQALRAFPTGRGEIDSIALSPDGNRIVYALNGNNFPIVRKVVLIDVETGLSTDLLVSDNSFYGVAFSPKGTYFTFSSTGKRYLFCNENEPVEISLPSSVGVVSMAFSPDESSLFFVGNDDATIRTPDVILEYQTASGDLIRRYEFAEDLQDLHFIAITPNGDSLAVSNYDTIFFVDRASGDIRLRIPTDERPLALCFSPNGQYLFTAQESKAVLYRTDTGERVRAFSSHKDSSGYQGCIECIDFIDDNRVVTVGEDGTARIWTIHPSALSDWSVY